MDEQQVDGDMDISESMVYPKGVENALLKCLGSEDPLDDKEFDPIAYVNKEFPDEKSFARLEPFLGKLKTQIGALDVEICDAVKAQSTKAGGAMREIVEAKDSIKQLQSKIVDIKGRSEMSEKMVNEICRDIKKLDFAKRHLTYTITSLKRYHMLVTAVDQLDFMVENRQYHETANLLLAVNQLFLHFKEHSNIKTVQNLKESVDKTQDFLKQQIFRDFESLSEVSADYEIMGGNDDEHRQQGNGNPAYQQQQQQQQKSLFDGGNMSPTYDEPVNSSSGSSMFYSSDSQTPESLAGACAVVDAIGSGVRRQLIEKICTSWLEPYEKLFGPNGQHSGIDARLIESRYAWIRRLLRSNDERYHSIFPKEWCINKHLLLAFVRKTEQHIKQELRKIDPPESADVSALVGALRKTLDFENEMSRRFESDNKQETSTNDELTTKNIRMKYADDKEDEDGNDDDDATVTTLTTGAGTEDDEGAETKTSREQALVDAQALPSIRKIISAAFEPYLIAYVKLEGKNMREELNKVVQEESVDGEGPLSVFSSATGMFVYIRKSINRCVAFTRGQALYDLHIEFKKVLSSYAETLQNKLPRTGKALGNEDITTICFILNSADYCQETISGLQDHIAGEIDPAYEEAIDMDPEVDAFYRTIDASIRRLVAGVESMVEPDLSLVSKTNWAQIKQVGDQSKYVSTLGLALSEFIPPIRKLLSPELFQRFCDKVALSFVPKFTDTILRCKNVGDAGAQQLLLDVQAVKSLLLKMPEQDDPSSSSSSFNVFIKTVTTEMQRCEVLLKLVGMNLGPDQLIENFKLFLEEGSTEDLRKVLEMKGFKRVDQDKILRQAEQAGIKKVSPSSPQRPSMTQKQTGTSASGASAAAAASKTFTNVFSKMTDMKEQLDKGTANLTGGKGFSTFSANISSSWQSYNRKNNEK